MNVQNLAQEPSKDDATNSQLTRIKRVGEDRAQTLTDAGYQTVADVADAEVERLAKLPGFGPTLAARIKGSAQGHQRALEAEAEAEDADAEPVVDDEPLEEESTVERDPRRLAILAGADLWDDAHADDVFPLIEQAINRFSLELKDGDVIGFPAYSHGGPMVRNWAESKARQGTLVGTEAFHVDESIAENEDDPNNGPDWYEAYQERSRRMLEWADVCLVVEDGKFINSTLKQNPELGGARELVYLEADDDYLWTLPAVDSGRADALREAGFESIQDVADASAEDVHEVLEDLSEDVAADIYREAYYDTFGVSPPSSTQHSWENELEGSDEDEWYDSKGAPDDDPDRGLEHTWVADVERKQPSQYRYEGGEPGDSTLL